MEILSQKLVLVYKVHHFKNILLLQFCLSLYYRKMFQGELDSMFFFALLKVNQLDSRRY